MLKLIDLALESNKFTNNQFKHSATSVVNCNKINKKQVSIVTHTFKTKILTGGLPLLVPCVWFD